MITRSGIHALKALAVLAEQAEGSYTGASAIAEQISAPRNYLGKLLQTLAREHLVEGQKGLNGGFRLARPASAIRLVDVIEPIENVSRWSECFLGRQRCSDDHACSLHLKWAQIRDQYLEFLQSTTIADIAGDQRRPVCL